MGTRLTLPRDLKVGDVVRFASMPGLGHAGAGDFPIASINADPLRLPRYLVTFDGQDGEWAIGSRDTVAVVVDDATAGVPAGYDVETRGGAMRGNPLDGELRIRLRGQQYDDFIPVNGGLYAPTYSTGYFTLKDADNRQVGRVEIRLVDGDIVLRFDQAGAR